MKQNAILLVAFAVVSCGAAYGNSFLDGIVGRWSSTVAVITSINGQVVDKRTTEGDVRVTKLRNGTYYVVNRTGGKKTEESWFFKNGTLSSIIYTDDGLYDGEGSGTWRIRRGRLVLDRIYELSEAGKTVVNTSTRRIDRNTYAMRGTAVARITLPSVASEDLRIRSVGTYVRRW